MLEKIIQNKFLKIAIVIIAMGFFGCNHQNVNTKYIQYNQNNQTLKINKNLPQVLATTSVLCDLTKQIAGETINLTCLIPPGLDASIYQPTPEDIQVIKQANLILYHGHNFERSLIKVIQKTKSNSPKIAVAKTAVPQPKKMWRNGRSLTQPHIWHNVKNTIKIVEVINSNLIKLSPKNQNKYTSNTKTLTQELNKLHNWIKSRITTIPNQKRKLLTTHTAMIYYVQAYGLGYQSSLSNIRYEDNLTHTKVRNLAKSIQKSQVPTIFIDTTINPMLLQPISKKANVRLFSRQLYIDGLGKSGSDGDTYQKMMDANTRSIVEGLGGTYLKFTPNIGK